MDILQLRWCGLTAMACLMPWGPSFGQTSVTLHQRWSNQSWVTEARTVFTKNDNGQVVKAVRYALRDEEWMPKEREVFTYSAESLKQDVWQYYRQDTTWVLLGREVWAYNANRQDSVLIWQRPLGEDWAKVRRTMYAYNAAGHRVETRTEKWDNGRWIKERTWTSTATAEGKSILRMGEGWRSDDTWGATWRLTWEYEDDGRTEKRLTEEWQGGAWQKYHLDLYRFDSNGVEIERIRQNWIAGSWSNISRDILER